MAHNFEQAATAHGVTEWRHRDNRLTVLTRPTPVAPVVGFGVVYRVGSRHEGTGHTGATHLLEHLMFKGSRSFNREAGTEIARLLHRVGANFNATTWLDRTNYYEILPADHLSLAVDIEADRMRGALVRDSDLDSERTVVLNELDMGENEPFELLLKESFAHAFLEHPYRHPTIGWRSDVESMSAAVLRGFYDTYYHPNNATVLVVGDIDDDGALAAVERGFGHIPAAQQELPSVTAREGEPRGERRFEIHRAGELGCLAMTWRIPQGLHEDLPPLEVLTQVLADGVTSRLHQRLVESNRCLGVHAYALGLHDPGVFQIMASLAPGVEHGEVEEVIQSELARLRGEPPSSDEVLRAKVQTRTDLAFHHSSPGQIMAGLTEAVAIGDWRRFTNELELVSAVEASDLLRVAAEYLVDRRLTVGRFVPDGGVGGVGAAPMPREPRPCFLHRPFAERVGEHALPGGGRLAVLSNPYAPTVTVAGTLRAGLAAAGDGRLTVPGMAAAMLDRGTESRDRLQLARELEDHGLQIGVRTSAATPTLVWLTAHGLADELPRLAELLIDVLRRPAFSADELEKLRERVLGGLVRESEDTHALAYAALTRHLYRQGHPLRRRPIDERRREIEGLMPADLQAFHELAYGPDSLVLTVVGDVEGSRTASLFGELIGGWQGCGEAAMTMPDAGAEHAADERIDIPSRPNLDVFLGHRGRLRRGDPDEAAAILANSCLGQSTLTSRLGLAVRGREGLSYGVYSRFFGTVDVAGPWATHLTVSSGDLDQAVSVCRDVISRYVDDGPTEEELSDERLAQSGAYRVGLATNSGVARELVTTLSCGQSADQLDSYPSRVLEVEREDVVRAIRRHLVPGPLVITAAGTLGSTSESDQ